MRRNAVAEMRSDPMRVNCLTVLRFHVSKALVRSQPKLVTVDRAERSLEDSGVGGERRRGDERAWCGMGIAIDEEVLRLHLLRVGQLQTILAAPVGVNVGQFPVCN